jgi:subtilisin family serine protease
VRRLALAAAALALVAPAAARAYSPNDPYVARQWYLSQDHAFDFWPAPPVLPAVRVAVVDSGIDGSHPEFAGRIAAAKSFVGGSALTDEEGHGTFVSGEIAAATGNEVGIAAVAPPARLLVAKVVAASGAIPLSAEVRAIHWAVAHGARVINLSLGGVRDPLDPKQDTFSPAEQTAIEYAVRHGVLVVAAVGNGDDAPTEPWTYASWPAALPHVLGVSAFGPDGSVPSFSNRDAVYDDIAAPGQEMFSTFPYALTKLSAGCPDQGYSSCGSRAYRRGDGTSFSAPQVAAAAAVLFALRPALTADQASKILERSADDATPATGCKACRVGRDSLTGWGSLDVASAVRALQHALPTRDRLEPNDDAGGRAVALVGRSRQLVATLDYWDDRRDVYRVLLRRGQRISATVRGRAGTRTDLALWKPGTRTLFSRAARRLRVAHSARPSTIQRIAYTARAGGRYYLGVTLPHAGAGSYRLILAKR